MELLVTRNGTFRVLLTLIFVVESEIVEASESEYGADDNHEPYSACEPIADEYWITEYRQRRAEKEQRLASLNDGLAGRENINNW